MWIAILVPVGAIALVAVLVGAGFSVMKHEYGDRRELLAGASDDAKKALVVYQPSLTAASSDVAHAIAQGLHDSGCEVTLNVPGRHLSEDIGGYTIVVFGSPNYGGSPGQPLLDYLKRIDDFSGKRILLYSTSGSAEGRLEFDKMAALLRGTEPYDILKLAASHTEENKAAAYQFGKNAAQ